MKFFLITSTRPTNQGVVELLLAAASAKNIEVVRIDSDCQLLADMDSYESRSTDIVYREALGEKARAIEAGFLYRPASHRPSGMRRPSQNIELTFPWSPLLRYQQLGIPAIPTILLDGVFVEQSDDEIARRVQTIGGFPVILKQVGLSHGAGVQKIDSMRQLRDVLRTVDGRDIQKYALRQYLAVYRHARLVVLDGRVIDSIEYIVPEDDFRTNAGTVSVVPQKFDVEVEKAAIDTVNSLAAVMGGVDILIDVATQTPYVAECNSPCNFWRNQNTTGVPIAEKIIEYLAGDRT